MKETKYYRAIIEALLFASNNPITMPALEEVLKDVKAEDAKNMIQELNAEYERTNRSFMIEEIAGGWQMRTKPDFSPWIKALLNIQRRERLSGPALETLAIVAYKQPITKAEIEGIRGVNTDWVLSSLVDKNLVRIVGRKEVIGRPFMYGTTTRFLEHFGLANLKDLPEVEELRSAGNKVNCEKPKETAVASVSIENKIETKVVGENIVSNGNVNSLSENQSDVPNEKEDSSKSEGE